MPRFFSLTSLSPVYGKNPLQACAALINLSQSETLLINPFSFNFKTYSAIEQQNAALSAVVFTTMPKQQPNVQLMQSLYNVPFYAPAALAAWGLQPLSEGFAEQRGTAKIFNPNQSSDANSIWLVLDDTVFCNRLPMQTSRASLTALKSYQNFLNNLARQTGLSQLYIFPAYGPPSTLQAELLSNAKLLLRPV